MTHLALLLAVSAAAAPAPAVYKSGPARVRLIELYSSEGCSSCPPADAWLSSLRGKPGLWTDFVPVSFQVDYWDYLGWNDPLGSPENSARQRSIAARWGSSGVYTPGLVLDGAEWRSWRGGGPPTAGEKAGVLEARAAGGRVRAVYRPAPGEAPAALVVARLAFGVRTTVTRGENSGETLRHDFVSRGFNRVALRKGKDDWSAETALPADAGPSAESAGLAVWVEDAAGVPLQAAGGPL